MIADYNRVDFTPAADQQTDLPVNFAGKKTQLRGELGSDNIFRWYSFAIKALYLF
jgi:hypothetical protein